MIRWGRVGGGKGERQGGKGCKGRRGRVGRGRKDIG